MLAALSALPSYAATLAKGDINRKEGMILEYLEDVEKLTGHVFIYSMELKPVLEQVVKTDLSGKEGLSEVLDVLFYGRGIAYTVNGKQIILKKVPVSEPAPAKKVQQPVVSGIVVDDKGESVIGAFVSVAGDKSKSTITDIDGKFSLNVPAGTMLEASCIGYATKKIEAQGNGMRIVLEEDSKILEEVVVVAYGSQNKATVTGSITSISKEDLVQSPQANISNSLVGRMPGLIATQRSGAPGEDASTLYIRGVGTFTDNTSPLIMVDGVERPSFDGIDPNEIESLNILKDASATAVYGVKGANGVILITTRKGQLGAPHISYSGNVGLQVPTALPSYLNSAQYAMLYNEAGENDARATGSTYIPRFSQEDIQKYADHSDPIMHPDMDWVNMFIRKVSTRTQHNVNISGGIEKVKYFISGSFYDQTGIYNNTRIDNDHDVNPRSTRYNFRSNFDFQPTKDFSAQVQVAAQIESVISPSGGNSSIWQAISFANPLSSPGLVDGKIVKIENSVGSVNPWQVLLSNGYNKRNSNTLTSSVKLAYDFSTLVTKGLSVHALAAFDSYYYSNRKYSKTYPYYFARRDEQGDVYLVRQNEETIWNTSTGWSKNRKLYFEGAVHYDRSFGNHNVGALVLFNMSKYFSPALEYLVPNGYMGLVGRITYDYAHRYMVEFDMGYNGTENFAASKRFGFFPATSVGWILTEEPWMPKNDILTYMKIRASYGEVGNDKIGGSRFLYLPTSFTEMSGALYGYNFGIATNPNFIQSIAEDRIGNPDLTWEKARKSNVGLDFNMFKGRLTVTLDGFYEIRNNILAKRSTEPVITGATLPPYNLGSMQNFGCEADATYRDKVGDFHYWLRGNFSFARNQVLYKDEVDKQFAYQRETGRRVGQYFGLIFDGYYNNWEEVNALDRPVSAWSGNLLQPGDCKYVDVNKDGKIDNYDMVPLGFSNVPEIVYGASLGFSWKGIDFSILFQGADNVSIKYFGRALWPFSKSEESAKSLVLNRWTPERYAAGEDILFPRLSLNPNSESDHNYRPSSLWIRDARYLRLKNIEIGYNFPKNILQRAHMAGLRLFFNGSNLATWSPVIDLDPEVLSTTGNTEINSYPLQKVFNFGLNITF